MRRLALTFLLLSSIPTLLSAHPLAPRNSDNQSNDDLKCSHVIIGAGCAGLYTAVHLSTISNAICIFEKESHSGGRWLDVNLAPGIEPQALGAWRFPIQQNNTLSVVDHYKINYTEWEFKPTVYEDNGSPAENSNDILGDLLQKAYPDVWTKYGRYDFWSDMERNYEQDLKKLNLNKPSLGNYVEAKFGEEVRRYLGIDINYHSIMESDAYWFFKNNVKGLLLVKNERRPEKGMSEIGRQLTKDAKDKGVKLFLSEPITKLDRDGNGYVLKTDQRTIKAEKVIINLTPTELKKIDGDVVKDITSNPIFQSILPISVFKAVALYPTNFWKDTLEPLDLYYNLGHRLGQIVQYRGKGPNGEVALNAAYIDSPYAEQAWGQFSSDNSSVAETLIDRLNTALAEVLGQNSKSDLPKPIQTATKYWDRRAWHLQEPGSMYSYYDVEDWAKKPLKDVDTIFLAGEAYAATRFWAQGALATARNGLGLFGIKPEW